MVLQEVPKSALENIWEELPATRNVNGALGEMVNE
jgi:hypothetical protein